MCLIQLDLDANEHDAISQTASIFQSVFVVMEQHSIFQSVFVVMEQHFALMVLIMQISLLDENRSQFYFWQGL